MQTSASAHKPTHNPKTRLSVLLHQVSPICMLGVKTKNQTNPGDLIF